MTRDTATRRPGETPLDAGAPITVPASSCAATEGAVRERAAALIRRLVERTPGWTPPPFDPRRLAEALDIPIHFRPDLRGPDALIVRRGGQFHILADGSERNAGRLNFTLAHEIAHTFFAGADEQVHLRSRDRKRYDGTPGALALERLCDAAASELLMPAPHFDADVERLGFAAETVPVLAETYRVSLEAAALRLLRCREGAVAVGFFDHDVRPSMRGSRAARNALARYRVHRVFRGRSFPYLFPDGKSVPEESVIYRASLNLQMCEAVETFRLGSRQRRLRVSAFPLHRGGVVEGPPRVCAVFTDG